MIFAIEGMCIGLFYSPLSFCSPFPLSPSLSRLLALSGVFVMGVREEKKKKKIEK